MADKVFISPTVGHKKGNGTRRYCVYTVWDNRTDELIILDGTAPQCAEAMGVALSSFYAALTKTKAGRTKRWYIERNYLDGKPDVRECDECYA